MVGTYLAHHGIKGQKWGTKNGPPYPLSKTDHNRVTSGKTLDEANDILSTFSEEDKNFFGITPGNSATESYEEGEWVAKRFILKNKDIPVAMLEFMDLKDGELVVAVGTKSGDQYRGKGYASNVTKIGMDWINDNIDKLSKDYSRILWNNRVENEASAKLAEKNGFKYVKTENGWDYREFKLKE